MFVLLLLGTGALQWATGQDQHIDPNEIVTVHELGYDFHEDITLSSGQRMTFQNKMITSLQASSELLMECNSKETLDQDVGAGILVKTPAVPAFGGMRAAGLVDVITTQAELDAVLNYAGNNTNIKIVSTVSFCDGMPVMGVGNACSKASATPASIVIGSGALAFQDRKLGSLVAHELGRTLGLVERTSPGNPIMNPVLSGDNDEVNATEAAAFHMNGVPGETFRNLDLALVIDDTGSMGDDIGGVKRGLERRLGKLARGGLAGNVCPAMQMVTFKDAPTRSEPTTDLDALKDQVAALFAAGGGDCPEDAQGALDQVKNRVKDNGTVFFATDASPRGVADPDMFFDNITSVFRGNSIRVHTLLTGTCSGGFKSDPNAPAVASKFEEKKEAGPRLSSGHVMVPAKSGATDLELGDDDKQEVLLPFTFDFAGDSYSTVFVGSNGFITFANSDTSPDATGDAFASGARRIAGLWTDLDPESGGTISAEEVAGNFHIAFTNVPDIDGLGLVNFTFILRPNHTFAVQYGEVTTTSGIAGATTGARDNFGESDLSALANSTLSVDFNFGVLYEDFSGNFDLNNTTLEYAAVTLDHPLPPISEVEIYSTLSQATGGLFLFLPEVKFGGGAVLQRYENIVSNVVQGSFSSAIAISEPGTGSAGATLGVTLTGIGTDFQEGTTLTVSGDGVEVLDVQVVSPTQLQAILQISAGAELGFRDLIASTDLGGDVIQEAEGTESFEITAATSTPAIVSVTPSTGMQGEVLEVVVSGNNTSFTNTSAISFGDDVTVQSVELISATQLSATIAVNADAEIGYRDITVISPGEVVENTGRGPFFISQMEEAGVPALLSVSPSTLAPGASHTIVVGAENTNFLDGLSVVSITGSGVTVLSSMVNAETEITAEIAIAEDADPGFRDVRVVTGAEAVLLSGGISISALAPAAPLLADPADGAEGIDPASVTFRWNSAARALTYHVQVARDIAFTDVFLDVDALTDTTITETLTGTTTFFWRVQATNDAGTSGWSDPSQFTTAIGVGTDTFDSGVPTAFALNQNYPNPFNPSTEIRFALPEAIHVQLTIYDVSGREVTRLVDRQMSAGFHAVTWDAENLPSGIYLYRISAGSFSESRTMTFLK